MYLVGLKIIFYSKFLDFILMGRMQPYLFLSIVLIYLFCDKHTLVFPTLNPQLLKL